MAVAVIAGVFVSASPAQAGQLTVSSSTFSMSSFPEVCQSGCSASSGGYVRLWQQVLYSTYGSQTSKSCAAFVDGQFGPTTRTWTIRWQTANGLGGDGRVGPQTWGRVYALLILVDSGPNWTAFRYQGAASSFPITRFYVPPYNWVFTYC